MSSNSTLQINKDELPRSDLEAGTTGASGIVRRLRLVVDDKLIRGFSPAYFVPIMGTGISSTILYKFPFPARWLEVCAYIMFAIAVIIFCVTVVCFLMSMVRYPDKVAEIHFDPKVAPFMGCLPMGYITLVNFLYYLTGTDWIIGVWVLWWVSVALSVYTAFVVFYTAYLAKRCDVDNYLDPKNLHATILLPIVTLTVAASCGNLITPDLPSVDLQIITMTVTYILWANAIALAVIIISVHYWKLFVYKVPPTPQVFTTFLPVGVLGQGAFGILLFGKNISFLVLKHHRELASSHYLHFPVDFDASTVDSATMGATWAQVAALFTAMISLFLTSFGYFSTYVAMVTCLSKVHPFTKNYNKACAYNPTNPNFFRRPLTGLIDFNRTFWAMTFPLGTMALANNELSKTFGGLKAFQVIAAIYATALLVITVGCLLGVFHRLYGSIKYIFLGSPSRHFG